MRFSGVVPIRVLTVFLAVFAAIFVLAPGARAQQVAGAQVAGYVTDPSGQAILGAQVNMIELDKHASHIATTDATGRYVLPNLPVGAYRLEVTVSGFKTSVQTGITLQVDVNIDIPVVMQIGQVTESVQVAANAAMVETKENSISQLIGQQAIEDLPLNGRNPTQLFILSGATSNMTLNGGDLTGSKNIQGSNGSGQFSVAGAQANGINFLLDGGDNNDSFSNVNMPIPFPDAIQEFNVQFEGLPAQFGLHPGGVVNIATKSGANALHGDLFDYFRNGDLNARPEGYVGTGVNTQQPRDSVKRNQFGGTVGGKVKKDKLFFFAGYQGTRQRSDPAQNTAYVPTAAALTGDFSALDGAACLGTKARVLKDPTGKPYPVTNVIPQSSFDQAGFKLASTYLPTATNQCGSYQFGYLTDNPDDQIIGRMDWSISDKQTLYGRYFVYDFTGLSLFDGHNALTTGTPGNKDRAQTMTVGDNYTFAGGTKVNALHLTYMRRRDNRASASNMFSPKDLGVNMFINIGNYTQLAVSNYSGGGFNIGCGTCALANFDVNTYQFADDFTWIKGRHQIALGFDGRKQQFNSYNYQQANGQFTFNGQTSGDGLADLMIGRFSGLTDGNVISDYLRQTVIAAYLQDSFHASHNFTVNFGVRYEPFLPTYDKYGRGNQFSWPLFQQGWHSSVYPKAPAGLIFSGDSAQDPYGKAFTESHKALFSPRLGLVWDPKGDGKQTVRAAFNLMHDTPEMFYPERWTTNAPYVSSLTLTSGQFSNPFASYSLTPGGPTGDPFPGAAVFPTQGTYISVPPHLRPQYMMQWNVSYQRQVASDLLVTVNYMGNATRHIWGSTDVNYAVGSIHGASTSNTNSRRLTYLTNSATGQYYANIQQTDDGANAEYHGMFLTLKKRISHNYSAQGNYTWSHCISSWDFAGELAGVIYQNPANRATGERGNCGFDHRQTLGFSFTASSPGLGTGFAKAITEGWQLSPLVGFGTGNPIQLTDGGKDISLSGQGLDRPEVILPEQVYPSKRTRAEWFNPAAFQCNGSNATCTVSSGLFGNLGRNAVYAPGYINFDMALSRQIRMSERWKLTLRGDFFNILNHPNWANNPTTTAPGTSITTSSTFGVITAYSSPRIIQMAAKVFF